MKPKDHLYTITFPKLGVFIHAEAKLCGSEVWFDKVFQVYRSFDGSPFTDKESDEWWDGLSQEQTDDIYFSFRNEILNRFGYE